MRTTAYVGGELADRRRPLSHSLWRVLRTAHPALRERLESYVAFSLHTTYVTCLGPTYLYGECQLAPPSPSLSFSLASATYSTVPYKQELRVGVATENILSSVGRSRSVGPSDRSVLVSRSVHCLHVGLSYRAYTDDVARSAISLASYVQTTYSYTTNVRTYVELYYGTVLRTFRVHWVFY
jgi:hypothetical protein